MWQTSRTTAVAIGVLGAEVVALSVLKGWRYYRWLFHSEPFASPRVSHKQDAAPATAEPDSIRHPEDLAR
jgi:hypothetical protein